MYTKKDGQRPNPNDSRWVALSVGPDVVNESRSKSKRNNLQMVRARTEYKRSVRIYRFECRKQKTRQPLDLKYKNAKSYWKLLKDSQNTDKSNSLTAQKFSKYFKSINDQDTPFYQADEDILEFNNRFLNSCFLNLMKLYQSKKL